MLWTSLLGWGVGRVFWFCFLFGWLPFVHDLCTPGNFPFIYYTCFLLIKKKKRIVFEDAEMSIQKLTSFVYFLRAETKLCTKDGSKIFGFIEWLCSK